jgi:hypothetical protein
MAIENRYFLIRENACGGTTRLHSRQAGWAKTPLATRLIHMD